MILSYAIWTPIVFGLIILFYGSEKPSAGVRWLALIGAVIGFIATLPLITQFDIANPGMQFVEKISWIPRYDINYYLGIDGISVWFIVLTAFINIFVVIAAWEVIDTKVSQYMASVMILSGLMIGVCCAVDALRLRDGVVGRFCALEFIPGVDVFRFCVDHWSISSTTAGVAGSSWGGVRFISGAMARGAKCKRL